MCKAFWFALLAGIVLSLSALSASAQDQLTLGTSVTDFDLSGNGAGTTTLTLNIHSSGVVTFTNTFGTTVACVGQTFIFGCGSGAGSGSLSSSSSASGAAYYVISSSLQSPLTLQSTGGGNFSVNQAVPLSFSYSSPQGNLTGTIALASVTMVSGSSNTAVALGSLSNAGGSFASAFSSGGIVSLTFALGGSLSSIVGTNSKITGQVEYPSTITPSSSSCDFLTGGGWIKNPSGGGNGKANFAVAGGIKNCQFWGHLNYIDHATGMHVKGTGVTGYNRIVTTCSTVTSPGGSVLAPNAKTRHITGNAEIDGVGGHTYDVCATDNGEPGFNDVFELRLDTGYHAVGQLGGGTQGGGNIKLHNGNPSFCCKN